MCLLTMYQDLYLPHDQLTAVALRYPTNPLLHGRGQPGTHDVDIGTKILQDFRDNASTIRIPVYDKSAHEGLGDRLPSWHVIEGAVDIVLFEGWCLGFHSVPMSVLQRTMEVAKDVTPAPAYAAYTLQDVSLINQELAVWEQAWYPLLDAFIQLYPITPPGTSPWSLVYAWRLEAEHTMKQRNGGHGMTDEQVKAFVQRYAAFFVAYTPGTCPAMSCLRSIFAQPPRAGTGMECASKYKRIVVHKLLSIHSFSNKLSRIRLGAHEHAVVAVLHQPLLLRRHVLLTRSAHHTEIALHVQERTLGHVLQAVHRVLTEREDRVERRSRGGRRAILVRRAGLVRGGQHVAKVLLAVAAFTHLRRGDQTANQRHTREGRRRRRRKSLWVSRCTCTYASV